MNVVLALLTVTQLRIGSKAFTENVTLADIATGLVRAQGLPVEHRKQLGGTEVLWHALLAGEIDAYPEYTGTLRSEILADRAIGDDDALRVELARRGVRMSRSLGFNNTYALGMKADRADALGLRTISDLARHPELRFGFSNEFMNRPDGWPGLLSRYGLPQKDVRGLDHDVAYRALAAGTIDATDLYSTDAEIRYYGLRTLDDDRSVFPRYDAVFLWRASAPPGLAQALTRLEGRISPDDMVAMNAHVKLERQPEADVAAAFLARTLDVHTAAPRESRLEAIGRRTVEHLFLVGVSLLLALVVALPLGILSARRPALGQIVLAVTGLFQTIPSLALLVFMIPLLGIGAPPAIVALFLYSLLPIVRNTYTGLRDIPTPLRESAEALGLPAGARLRRIELPMASRAILAGIKTSAVINVGTATLGALIGAGGYGQPILTGIRLDDVGLILSGAVPAAALTLVVQGLFEIVERLIVPKGLRVSADR
jgi:osmoprotectant transport system permease protein